MSRDISRNFNPDVWKEYLQSQNERLPEIPNIERVSAKVIRIQAGNPGNFQLQGTSTYLIGSGRSRILIDTGEGIPIWLRNINRVLEAEAVEISHVLLTHWHGDHTGGVSQLLSQYPHLITSIYKNHPDKGQQPIEDNQVFSVDGATVRALFTPGHAIDHMCFILEEENALFTGDNVLGHGFTVVEDLGTFMSSLDIMQERRCSIGFPAHGIVIGDLPGRIALYRGRYMRRERQVVVILRRLLTMAQRQAALDEDLQMGSKLKSVTVSELVREIYGDVSDEISVMALQPSLNETLQKLAEDGKVGFSLELEKRTGSPCKRWFLLAF